MVVCCRNKAYEESNGVLDSLNGTLRLQPLDLAQIQKYFEDVERPDIWIALQNEAGLGALLKTSVGEETALLKVPLFLQILAVTYEPTEEVNRPISTKAALLEAYIERRLSVKGRKKDRKLASKKERKKDWTYQQVK